MDPGTVLVALFAIACGTGIIGAFFWMCVEVVKARSLKGRSEPLAAELHGLREEIRQLREQNADLILHYDTAVQRLAAASREPNPPRPAIGVGGAAPPARE
jgi:hypothetical protein